MLPQTVFESIDSLFEKSQESSFTFSESEKIQIASVIDYLDQGHLRVCEKKAGQWVTNETIKNLFFFILKFKQTVSSTPVRFNILTKSL